MKKAKFKPVDPKTDFMKMAIGSKNPAKLAADLLSGKELAEVIQKLTGKSSVHPKFWD